MSLEDAILTGGAQGASMIAVFALYLDRRLSSIEKAIKELVDALRPPRDGGGRIQALA